MSRNNIQFELPNDGLRAAASRTRDVWSVAFVGNEGDHPLLKAFLFTDFNGDGCTNFEQGEWLEGGPEHARSKRLVEAAVFLGSTLANSPDHLSVASADPESTDPHIEPILRDIGYRGYTLLIANAGLIRASLGPTFPVEFSLSPAETDY